MDGPLKVNMLRHIRSLWGNISLQLNVFGSEYTSNTINNNNNNQLDDCHFTAVYFLQRTGMEDKSGKLNSPHIIINCLVWNNDDDAGEQKTKRPQCFGNGIETAPPPKVIIIIYGTFPLANGKMPSDEYFLTRSRAGARKTKFPPNRKFGIVHSLAAQNTGSKWKWAKAGEERQRCKIMKTWMGVQRARVWSEQVYRST